MTHAARTFLAMLEVAKLNQLAFAARAGISHSTITRFIQGREPSAELLRLLCTAWDDPRHGLEILRAHLLDEIERAGRESSDLEIRFPVGQEVDSTLARSIEILESQSRADPDLRSTMLELAKMIERHAAGGSQENYLAAEPTPDEIANSVELRDAPRAPPESDAKRDDGRAGASGSADPR